jgi:hypothetical protein
LEEFSARFRKVVRELRPPWFEREARIDFDTYLPIVEGDEFDGLGGGVRGAINIAYHVALLGYALSIGATHVPSLLIIDSPRRNLGANAVDRALAQRIYEHFSTFQEARGTVAPSRPFQLIIADNDLPATAAPGARRIKFDHDNPFVPGVNYATTSQAPDDLEDTDKPQ